MPCFRICLYNQTIPTPVDFGVKDMRKWWENWDLRILILYILFAQLYLLFFGRLRRKSTSVLLMIVNVWLLYLFSDLFATIALGKLSKIKVKNGKKTNDTTNSNGTMDNKDALRVMWAPLILFYLGGPDTITVLRIEENRLWVRHLIGLLTQGLRTAYALIVTWSMEGPTLSLVALLIFVPGVIKYGERVWAVWSNFKDNYTGFIKVDPEKIDSLEASLQSNPNTNGGSRNQIYTELPNTKLVLRSYAWFQTLMPHAEGYDEERVRNLESKFREWVSDTHGVDPSADRKKNSTFDPFKLMEIELGLMYDMLFSKLGMIFTVWGSVLRLLTFCFTLSVLVVFVMLLKWDKCPKFFKGDDAITIILLAGAIFLDLAGIVAQLRSEGALVWACNNCSTWWATPVFFLHENLVPQNRERWSGEMRYFSLRDFCTSYKRTVCNKKLEYLFGREILLKIRYSRLQKSPVQDLKDPVQVLKDLIIHRVCEIFKKPESGDTSVQTSTDHYKKVAFDKLQKPPVRRGEWTLESYGLAKVEQFKKCIELEFGQSIVVWHVATEVFYESNKGNDGMKEKREAVKMLSCYMMYLLVACHSRFPFCDKYGEILQDYPDMKKIFDGEELVSFNSKGVGKEGGVKSSEENEKETLVNKAKELVLEIQRNQEMSWDIMGSLWVEMICYAAWACKAKYHVEQLRHGGEFLSQVWLLLMHFGVRKEMERSHSSTKDEQDSGVKNVWDVSVGKLFELEEETRKK